jgi:hypothetical protein
VALGITKGVRVVDIDNLPAAGRVCGVGGDCFSAGSGDVTGLACGCRVTGAPEIVRVNCTLVGLEGLADEGPDDWKGSLAKAYTHRSHLRRVLPV